jgi:hypothetical protein
VPPAPPGPRAAAAASQPSTGPERRRGGGASYVAVECGVCTRVVRLCKEIFIPCRQCDSLPRPDTARMAHTLQQPCRPAARFERHSRLDAPFVSLQRTICVELADNVALVSTMVAKRGAVIQADSTSRCGRLVRVSYYDMKDSTIVQCAIFFAGQRAVSSCPAHATTASRWVTWPRGSLLSLG